MNPRIVKIGFGIVVLVVMIWLGLESCLSAGQDEYAYATDEKTIQHGNLIFDNNCTSCHNFKTRGIGPNLAGITQKVSADWLKQFIKNPMQMIQSGDKRSVGLFEDYGQYMPPYAMLSDKDLDAILAYLNIRKKAKRQKARTDWGTPLEDPIAEKVEDAGISLVLKEVIQMPFTAESGQRARINKLSYLPDGSKRLFVHDLRGQLYELIDGQAKIFLDLSDLKDELMIRPGHGSGLGSFAFHPEYKSNGLFYTTHSETPGSGKKSDFQTPDSIPLNMEWVLTEWKNENPESSQFNGSSRELMRAEFIWRIHTFQEVAFNPLAKKGDEDYGLLFMGIGDGGSVGQRYPFLAGTKTRLFGTIIRIDPLGNNSANGQYGIPSSNPFANDGDDKSLGEIYAYGLRNPHRFTWNPLSGELLSVCVGQHNIEELNIVYKGANYGWPDREGTFRIDRNSDLAQVYPLPDDDAQLGYTYPILQFDHDEALAICGGYVYTNEDIPLLKNQYVFGSIVNGFVFMADAKSFKQGSFAILKKLDLQLENGTEVYWPKQTGNEKTGHSRIDFRLGQDADGALYMMTKADGKIYKVINAIENDLS